MSENLIGQEIEAYCGKCKTDTLHVITALEDDKIGKVMCKICMSYHKFRKPADGITSKTAAKTKKSETKTTKKATRRPRRNKWTRMLEDSQSEEAIEYNMTKSYEVATTIHHKT